MTAEPWFAAYERAAFDEDGRLRRYTQSSPDPAPVPQHCMEGTLTMPAPPSLWGMVWGLLRLIGGRR